MFFFNYFYLSFYYCHFGFCLFKQDGASDGFCLNKIHLDVLCLHTLNKFIVLLMLCWWKWTQRNNFMLCWCNKQNFKNFIVHGDCVKKFIIVYWIYNSVTHPNYKKIKNIIKSLSPKDCLPKTKIAYTGKWHGASKIHGWNAHILLVNSQT